MRRFPWDILFTLLLGLGLGLAYSWLISPLRVVDADPVALRADFKDQYRAAIAASFAANGNLPRAEARLVLLGDTNVVEALNSQAQRMIASGEFTQADQLAALAVAIENGGILISAPITAVTDPTEAGDPTSTLPPSPAEIPFQFTETPPFIETSAPETQPVIVNPTPRPTRTPIPTVAAPFLLIAQDAVCDSTLPDGLLQIFVFNSKRRQVTGVRIIISWENGEDSFFTGLKPEIGNGYADFIMTPNISYTVRLAIGSDIASGLVAPTCQATSGESFLGGFKLTFQQQ
jgi:hypothetical protein